MSGDAAIGRRALLGGAGAVTAAGLWRPSPAAADDHAAGDHVNGDLGGRGKVRTGADVLAARGWRDLRGARLGVITNPTGVISSTLGSIVDALVGSTGITVGGVFGPEHGFRGAAQAGESEDTYVDHRTGVTVYDAYGADATAFEKLYAAAEVDVIVFDIQDVGARFYTYIWTMYQALIAAARRGTRFVILDRPNPLGGRPAGPLLVDGFTSGVGQDAIVQAHGMTVGELARFFNGELLPARGEPAASELEVVRMDGWRAQMRYADTGLPWIMPSPNMPTPDTALVYPGTGMFEATNLSEGRGTTRPFELIGAPYVDFHWAADLNRSRLPGVRFREASFTPTFSKNANQVCSGVQVHVDDPQRLDAIRTATTMLTTARDRYDAFDWRGDGGRWIDLLTGSGRFRQQFEAGESADAIVGAWRAELAAFDRRRRPYLLYRR